MVSVVIRCDGSSTLGMGHLVRCLALAEELKRRSVDAAFAVREGADAISRIAAAGYDAVHLPDDYRPEDLIDVARRNHAGLFFLDQRDSFSAESVARLHDAGYPIVVYDDLSERRLAADVCIYPPIQQVAGLDWTGFRGDLLTGWEWVLLRPEFAGVPRRHADRDPPRVLITMGGADPQDFTFDALEAITDFPGPVTVLVGPMMAHAAEIGAAAKRMGDNVGVVSSPSNMVELMVEHDLALASFGVTAYELAACGVPTALWALTEDHRLSADAFAEAEIATVAGHPGRLAAGEVSALVQPWLGDAARRSVAGARAQRLCDGRGVERVADRIVELAENRQ
jgi:spore coat polysaccharide biosynthesis predicted glycosyltransferase SpsG